MQTGIKVVNQTNGVYTVIGKDTLLSGNCKNITAVTTYTASDWLWQGYGGLDLNSSTKFYIH